MAPKARGARSVSLSDSHLDHDSDEEEQAGGSAGKGKGRKEGKEAQDQRKIQNRIAQREFRQRKQQYIKDLEARVELNESSRDDQLEQLRKTVTALIGENQKLRELLASVSGFIGSGLGGILPSVGIDLPEFQALISRQSSDLVHDILKEGGHGHAPRPTAPQYSASVASSSTGPGPAKRPRTSDSPQDTFTSLPPPTSNANRSFELPPLSMDAAATPILPPMFQSTTPASATSSFFPTAGPSSAYGVIPTGQPGGSTDDSMQAAIEVSNEREKSRLQQAGANAEIHKMGVMTAEQFNNPNAMASHEAQVQKLFTLPTDNPKLQAIQLISYHMRNRRENPNYKLPPSLKPTVTQLTVPHSPFFDGIIFASLRDRLILLKDQYDIQTLLDDLLEGMEIHENDIMVPANWELSETFLRKYWYCIDVEVLQMTNHWRKQRGEPELLMSSIVPDSKKDSW